MKNLVIGDTSQLAHYFPDSYEKISSRNIDYSKYYDKKYNSVYICFAEQRTFIEDDDKLFDGVNLAYTLEVINLFKNISDRVVIYSTSELWNNVEGSININTPFNYNYSPYIKSKERITNFIKDYRKYNQNVIIMYPFNFNTPYRKEGFLFNKIFNSIIKKKKIEIGDTNFNRDLIHPSIVVERSIKAKRDEIVGSGNLINVKQFIVDLYKSFNMDFNEYVTENFNNNLKMIRKEYYADKSKCSYENLLEYTINDIKKIMSDNGI